jgi:hypothetical protein
LAVFIFLHDITFAFGGILISRLVMTQPISKRQKLHQEHLANEPKGLSGVAQSSATVQGVQPAGPLDVPRLAEFFAPQGIADALGDAFEMHAHEIHVYKVHSHEVHAYEVHGH